MTTRLRVNDIFADSLHFACLVARLPLTRPRQVPSPLAPDAGKEADVV